MKKIALSLVLLFTMAYGHAQTINPNYKFPPQQLKSDLSYLKAQLFNAHANPFTELSKTEYEKVFDEIDKQLTDSLTATAFYKLLKPTVAYLSDEHAQISINAALQTDEYKKGSIFLPITLSRKGNAYTIDEQLTTNTGLQKGEAITRINGEAIAGLVNLCTRFTMGFPAQRAQNALQQFGYLYTVANPRTVDHYEIKTGDGKTVIVKGTTFKTWQDYIVGRAGQADHFDKSLTYTRYGDAGYINSRVFDARTDKEMDSLKRRIAEIFHQIKTDGVKYLFIDVSKNSGGNSAVGDALIDYFYAQPYRGYQCNWKRSDEYLGLIKSWGMQNADYAAQPVGKVIHFDSSESTPFNPNPYRFTGKVYVVVGDGTFSSAIMFATVIKDNHIATLIGQAPQNGHPNHFGELYNNKLPNTKIDVRFGVKEWIRPAGKSGENILRPDILVDLNHIQLPEELIKQVVK